MTQSQTDFKVAQEYIPGGVNSPVRAFGGVNGDPIFIASAQGATITDVDGKQYIDFVGSWGPMILGHNDAEVIAAIEQQLKLGVSYGAPTELETEMAQFLCQEIPNLDMVRMVSSGTEATMSAIRLARGYTKRNKIIKFVGCYHGHSDALLVAAGSGGLTFGVPSSAGVTPGAAQDTLTAEYNNLASVAELFANNPAEIAAVIVEPVAGNMNCIPPTAEFIRGLRSLCDQYGSLLIFDEVMTGFRVAFKGSQEVYGVNADLITLGKVIGGGLPVGAFGGKREIMQQLAPLGPVYQAGTLSGNPLAMSAGLATLRKLKTADYAALTKATADFAQSLKALASKYGITLQVNHVGAMFGLFFTAQDKVETFAQVQQCDLEQFKTFHSLMLEHGVYLAPSAFEACFTSFAFTPELFAQVLAAAEKSFLSMTNK